MEKCKFGAVSLNEYGVAEIEEEKCIGYCGSGGNGCNFSNTNSTAGNLKTWLVDNNGIDLRNLMMWEKR